MAIHPIIRFAMLLYGSAACLAAGAQAADSVPTAAATGFDFATLERTAQSLAQGAFVPDRGVPGEHLERFYTYDQYRDITTISSGACGAARVYLSICSCFTAVTCPMIAF
jgi:glucan biosynthesis protein